MPRPWHLPPARRPGTICFFGRSVLAHVPTPTSRSRRGRISQLLAALAVLAGVLALPTAASASSDDVRVRFTGAMYSYEAPNLQPANNLVVFIQKQAWDFVWDSTVEQLGSSGLFAQPTVLVAEGQRLLTFTDRNPCRVELKLQPRTAPNVLVVRREADLNVARIQTPWGGNYIASDAAQCIASNGGYLGGTLAGHATWTPQQPSIDPALSVEGQGVEHLQSAIFRFNRETPTSTSQFRFDYNLPPGALRGNANRLRLIWFGRVTITTDPPKRLPTPINSLAQLPGSQGSGVPGDPPGPGVVTGETLDTIVDEVFSRLYSSVLGPRAKAGAGRAAQAAQQSVHVPLAPPEGWPEGGTLAARVCVLAAPAPGRACGPGQSVAGGTVVVRGTSTHAPGATGGIVSPPNPPLVVRIAAAGLRELRARTTKLLLVELTFTRATRRETTVLRRAATLQSLRGRAA